MKKSGSRMKKMAQLWNLVIPYWKSEEKYKALAMLISIISLSLGMVYIAVRLNEWNAKFYNAIQQADQATFIHQCYIFFGFMFMMISVFVLNKYLTRLLSFHWRKWLTKKYLNRWMENANYYRISLQANSTDNPDQRIAQDLSSFSATLLDLVLSAFKETVNLFSFIVILWAISGPVTIPLQKILWTTSHLISIPLPKFLWAIPDPFSFLLPKISWAIYNLVNILFPNQATLAIPGYLVWIALIYAFLGTWGVFKIGKPLIQLDFTQEKYEANFRYQLVRLREKSEEVALYHGERPEMERFRISFNAIYGNFRQILYRGLYVNAWQNFYNNLSIIFPFIVVAPSFFSGAITFGIVMQIYSAFTQVKDSLAILVLNYNDIAGLIATTNRILGFSAVMDEIDANTTSAPAPETVIECVENNEEALVLENLTLKTPSHKTLLMDLNILIHKAEKVLIMGRSGLGKSTLLRAIAGVWSYGEGCIRLPMNENIFIVPQRPYMPLGTLRQAICYPGPVLDIEDSKLLEVLTACRLEHLMPMLDEHQDWSLRLSMGEQQRIIFVRAIIHQPAWIMMDEPSASMDKETERQVYLALHHFLPKSTVITIGHSQSLKAFHSRVIELDPIESKGMESIDYVEDKLAGAVSI